MTDKPNDQPTKTVKQAIYTKEIIIDYLENKEYPLSFEKNKKRHLRDKVENMKMIDGKIHQKLEENGAFKLLFFAEDNEEKAKLIIAEHNKAHFKTAKMYERLNNLAIGITRNDIISVIDKCKNCQIQNKIQRYNTIKPIIAKHTFHRFQIVWKSLPKFITSLLKSKNHITNITY